MRATRLVLVCVSLFLALARMYMRMGRGDGDPVAYAASSAPEAVVAQPAPPAVQVIVPCAGDQVGRVKHVSMELVTSVRGMGFVDGQAAGVHAMSRRLELETRVETLAVAGDMATRIKVSYARRHAAVVLFGAPAAKDDLTGKTYVVDAGGAVTTETGRPVSASEAAMVKADFDLEARNLGRGTRCGVPITAGQRLAVDSDRLAGLGSGGSRLTYVFRGLEGAGAVFDASASYKNTMEDRKKGFTVAETGDLDTRLVYDARTGELLSADGSGPLRQSFTTSFKGHRMSGSGAGKMQLRVRVTPE